MKSRTNLLPAVVIGGPPHSGKSVLAYSLSRALRARQVPHYVLRAYPDGEGDWANEADPHLVRVLRVKGEGSPEWIEKITRDISNRPLPLIVDPGGKPTAWQEAVFRECTHGILLSPDETARASWAMRFERHNLVLLADFKSELAGENRLVQEKGHLSGALAGLERGARATGPAFEELGNWLARLFGYSAAELRAHHFSQAPTELVIDLPALGKTLEALDTQGNWLPSNLGRILNYLPKGRSFAVYDRAPNWLYAALALGAYPQPFFQFDARLGWVRPPNLHTALAASRAQLQSRQNQKSQHVHLEFVLDSYLDYLEAFELTLPQIDSARGVILSGRLPLWMYSALALAYRNAAWLAVYQPTMQNQAVVISSHTAELSPGSLVDLM